MHYAHIPVLLSEAVKALCITQNGKYIDCTFGGGGYSVAIAQQGGYVLGLDADNDALIHFHQRNDLSDDIISRITLVHANFETTAEHAQRIHFIPVDGVVFDLGVSSFQLDTASKGFSFMRSGPLDMRLDRNSGISAGRLLDLLDEASLARVFQKFSDELHAKKIAHAIISERENNKHGHGTDGYWEHQSTSHLAELITRVVGGVRGRIHPATRVFQALRMAVNDETGSLERGLVSAWSVLRRGGVLVVVAFHSVEDRIVKDFMRVCERNREGKIIGDIITPSEFEISQNPRSRSAKMRVIEKS